MRSHSPPPLGPFYDPAPPITLLGDGPNVTKLVRNNNQPPPAGNGFVPLGSPWPYGDALLSIRRSFTTVAGLSIDNAGAGSSGGMVIIGNVPSPTQPSPPPSPSGNLRNITLRDLILRNNSSYVLRIVGGLEPAPIQILCSYERLVLGGNLANALLRIETRNTTQEFRQVQFTSFVGKAIELEGCEGVSFHECLADTGLTNNPLIPFLGATEARNCQVMNCLFAEGDSPLPTVTRWFIDLGANCNGWTILGTRFVRRIVGDSSAKAIRVGASGQPCFAVVIIDPVVSLVAGVPESQFPIELRDSATECMIIGGLTEIGTSKKPMDFVDPTTKSAWIGHRRWRVPTLSNIESDAITTNRHHGDIQVRLGQGVHAFSGLGSTWIPMSVNRVPNESVMNGIAASAKDKGTMVWVDTPSGANSHLRIFNGTTWDNVSLLPP